MQTYIVLALVACVVVVVLSKVFKKDQEQKPRCPSCGKKYGGKPRKCPHCGETLKWK